MMAKLFPSSACPAIAIGCGVLSDPNSGGGPKFSITSTPMRGFLGPVPSEEELIIKLIEKEHFSPDKELLSQVSANRPSVDWKETPAAHVFKVEVPGVKKEDIKIEVEEEGRLLNISGNRSAEKIKKDETRRHAERRSGKFSRKFYLPDNAKLDDVSAELVDGLHTVTLAKVEPKKKLVKSVEISG